MNRVDMHIHLASRNDVTWAATPDLCTVIVWIM